VTKQELKVVVDDLRSGKSYWAEETGAEGLMDLMAPLEGLALPDFQKGKMVRRETVVAFLRWQALRFNGTVDEEELSECLGLLKQKQVILV